MSLNAVFPQLPDNRDMPLSLVVGTTFSPHAVSTVTDLHVSVTVHYLSYSGRSEYRDGDVPETVPSGTSVRRGSCVSSLGILHPSSLFWFPPPSSFFFSWGSPKFLYKLGVPTYRLIDLSWGGPRLTSYNLLQYLSSTCAETVTDKIRKYRVDYDNNPPNSIVSTSGRLHSELVCLLFLQDHRETDRFFTV
jgi:hypothetical protein